MKNLFIIGLTLSFASSAFSSEPENRNEILKALKIALTASKIECNVLVNSADYTSSDFSAWSLSIVNNAIVQERYGVSVVEESTNPVIKILAGGNSATPTLVEYQLSGDGKEVMEVSYLYYNVTQSETNYGTILNPEFVIEPKHAPLFNMECSVFKSSTTD